MMTIPFNIPTLAGEEQNYVQDAALKGLASTHLQDCSKHLESRYQQSNVFLTSSCTTALEMSALLLNIKAGDEVIMPSFTFVSTANAFAMRGATIVFVDIRPDTMNIDERYIQQAITPKTKAIVPVHYGGVGCNMENILEIAKKNALYVIEDAAHCYGAAYKKIPLGTLGTIGTISFDYMKNLTSAGEGGALLVQDTSLVNQAEIILNRGTDYLRFTRGEVPQYTWQGLGSSYRLSTMHAAYLLANLQQENLILAHRRSLWDAYYAALQPLEEKGVIELPKVPKGCEHNAHIFFIKVKNTEERQRLINHLQAEGIKAAPHYVPLHSSPMGKKIGYFSGEDVYTTKESLRLLRLPIYHQLDKVMVMQVANNILNFY